MARIGEDGRRRWSLSKLDVGLLMESLYALTWSWVEGRGSINDEWERIRGVVWQACDTAMPRSKPCPPGDRRTGGRRRYLRFADWR